MTSGTENPGASCPNSRHLPRSRMSLRPQTASSLLFTSCWEHHHPWLGTSAAPPFSKAYPSCSTAHCPESGLHSQPPASCQHALLTPCLNVAQPYSPAISQDFWEVRDGAHLTAGLNTRSAPPHFYQATLVLSGLAASSTKWV